MGFYVLQSIVLQDKVVFTLGSSRKRGWIMFFDYSVTWSALVCTQYKNLPRWLNNKKLLAHITKRDRLQGKFDLVAQMRSSKAEFLSSPL